MSEVDNVQPDNRSDAQSQESNNAVNDNAENNNTVQYDTYKRVLGKLKNTEGKFDELNEQLQKLQREKLEAEGNKDELIDQLKKQIMEKDVKLKSTVGSIARSQAMSAIVDEAVKAGCNSPEVVKKYLEDQIDKLDFDTDFNPDREQVKMLIEEAKKVSPILFSKEAPKVASHNINNQSSVASGKKNLKKMPIDELMNVWAQSEGS